MKKTLLPVFALCIFLYMSACNNNADNNTAAKVLDSAAAHSPREGFPDRPAADTLKSVSDTLKTDSLKGNTKQ